MKQFVCAALCVMVSSAGLAGAQWTSDPAVNTPVVAASFNQDVFKLGVAPDGSSWVGWYDFQPGGVQVRVQRLDADGNQTFDPAGLVVSANPQNTSVTDWDLRADASGNCMLAFNDIRAGGDLDIYAYLISPTGTMLWGANGVTISDNTDFEADPRIIQNGAGEYVVIWSRSGTGRGLYMQRLAADGTPQLAAGGLKIAGVSTESPAFHEVVAVGSSDVVVSWVRDTTSFASPRHVFAQRFNESGQPQWGTDPVIVMNANVFQIAHRPRLIADANNQTVIAWHDTRTGSFRAYVQRLDISGNSLFPSNGRSVSNEANRLQLDPAIALAPGGDVMIFFRNLDSAQSQQSINVQRLDSVGDRLLGESGIELLPFNNQFKSPPRAARINGGVAAILDRQPDFGNPNGVLELLRVAPNGSFIDAGPISVSTATSQKGRLNLAEAGGGALIAAWSDTRNGDIDGYAQRINADGSLGSGGTPCIVDLNNDGEVNFFDVQIFLAAFSAQQPPADFNGDGEYNFFDVQIFLQAFSNGCP